MVTRYLFFIALVLFFILVIAEMYSPSAEGFTSDFKNDYAVTLNRYSINSDELVLLTDYIYYDPINNSVIEVVTQQDSLIIVDKDGNETTEQNPDSIEVPPALPTDAPGGPAAPPGGTAAPGLSTAEMEGFTSFSYFKESFTTSGSSSSSGSNFVYTSFDKFYSILHVPLQKGTFIHVMNLRTNKHRTTYYFEDTEIHHYNYTGVNIYPTGSSPFSNVNNNTGTTSVETFQSNNGYKYNKGDLYTDVSYEGGKIIIYGKKEDQTFRAVLFDQNQKLTIDNVTYDDLSSHVSTENDTEGGSSLQSSCASKVADDIKNIKETISMFKSIQDLFGNRGGSDNGVNNDYILKTQVVPPVCPSCPSYPEQGSRKGSGNGGGSGGGSGNDPKSLLRSTGEGTTSLIRDTGSGTDKLVRDTAAGTTNLLRDTASGIKGTVGDVGNFTKNTIGDVFGATRDIAGNVGNALLRPIDNENRGYQNSYEGPNIKGGRGGTYGGRGDPNSNIRNVPTYIPRTADFSSFGK